MFSNKLRKLRLAFQLRSDLWNQIRHTLSDAEWRAKERPFLPQIHPESLLANSNRIELMAPHFRGGNVAALELVILAALVSQQKAHRCFEIGTFDGNSTLQIAANAPGCRIYTLDLPLDSHAPEGVAAGDVQFIQTNFRSHRRFSGTPHAAHIEELFGDSKTFDFASVLNDQSLDLAFIDGSHSYEYVKNDTERLLPLLAKDACVIWHDYCRAWPGVVKFLNEFGRSHNLLHVSGTSLVYWKRGEK